MLILGYLNLPGANLLGKNFGKIRVNSDQSNAMCEQESGLGDVQVHSGEFILYHYLRSLRLKQLWSPWRMKYIQKTKTDECFLCKSLLVVDGPENLVVKRMADTYAILNQYPYTSGHLMVVPFEHVATLEELTQPTRAEMMELTSQCMTVLRKTYRPQAFNMGANIGEAAGAGVPGHVHIHIVPRWGGDTNFMSALGATRVLPEAIEDTYRRVREGFKSIS